MDLFDEKTIENIVSLLYQFYIREDVDFRSVEEYDRIASSLAREYGFEKANLLMLYSQFRKIVSGNIADSFL